MARHPTAPRVQREARQPDDAFAASVLETTAWAKENARFLTVGAILVAVVIFGTNYYRNYTDRLRDRAETQLTEIRATVLSGNAPLAIRDLETYLQSFGGTPTAREARLMLAQAYLATGQAQQAIEPVREMAADAGVPMGFSAAMLLAAAYEALAQPDDAAATYIRVADQARFTFQKAAALDAAARVRFEQGNPGAAVQLYDRLLGIIPDNDPERQIYVMRRAEAATRAAASG